MIDLILFFMIIIFFVLGYFVLILFERFLISEFSYHGRSIKGAFRTVFISTEKECEHDSSEEDPFQNLSDKSA